MTSSSTIRNTPFSTDNSTGLLKHTANAIKKRPLRNSVYTISAASPQDLVGITTLAYETLPERYTPDLFMRLYESYPEGYFVAKLGPHLIGFLIAIRTDQTRGRILMLGVKPEFRRKGVASALVRQYLLSAVTHHITSIELEVRTTNRSAIVFYEKMGFTLKEIVKGFYQNGMDAYVMHLRLQTY